MNYSNSNVSFVDGCPSFVCDGANGRPQGIAPAIAGCYHLPRMAGAIPCGRPLAGAVLYYAIDTINSTE
jgi:hypothetical protein